MMRKNEVFSTDKWSHALGVLSGKDTSRCRETIGEYVFSGGEKI